MWCGAAVPNNEVAAVDRTVESMRDRPLRCNWSLGEEHRGGSWQWPASWPKQGEEKGSDELRKQQLEGLRN